MVAFARFIFEREKTNDREHDLVQGGVLVVLLFRMGWLALVLLSACSNLSGVRSFVIFAARCWVMVHANTSGSSGGDLLRWHLIQRMICESGVIVIEVSLLDSIALLRNLSNIPLFIWVP